MNRRRERWNGIGRGREKSKKVKLATVEGDEDHSWNSGDLPWCNWRTAGPDGLTVQPLMYLYTSML